MNLCTPLGEIVILIDNKVIDYKYKKLINSEYCKDLDGKY